VEGRSKALKFPKFGAKLYDITWHGIAVRRVDVLHHARATFIGIDDHRQRLCPACFCSVLYQHIPCTTIGLGTILSLTQADHNGPTNDWRSPPTRLKFAKTRTLVDPADPAQFRARRTAQRPRVQYSLRRRQIRETDLGEACDFSRQR
jgi:hypothetical protein